MGIIDFPYVMTPKIVSFLKSYFALSNEEQDAFVEQYLEAYENKKGEMVNELFNRSM